MTDAFWLWLEQEDRPGYVRIKVLPSAPQTAAVECMEDGETWKFRVAAAPEKGKANKELVKFFRKQYGVTATVISGAKDRIKLLKLNYAD